MNRFIIIALLLASASIAQFAPGGLAKTITAADTSKRVAIPNGGTKLFVTVTGKDAFVSVGGSSVTASRDSATAVGQNVLVPAGTVGLIIVRNGTHFAAVNADSAQTARVQFVVGN